MSHIKSKNKIMFISESSLKNCLFDYHFERGRNFEFYFPENNLKEILKVAEKINQRRKSEFKKHKENHKSKFLNAALLKDMII